MRLPDWPLQQAIFTRLETDLSIPVYDYVPEKSKPPYVVIGDSNNNEDGAKQLVGFETTLLFHIFSSQPGMREVKELSSRVVESLTASLLDVEGWQVRCEYDSNDVAYDTDSRSGVIQMRFNVVEV